MPLYPSFDPKRLKTPAECEAKLCEFVRTRRNTRAVENQERLNVLIDETLGRLSFLKSDAATRQKAA